MLNGFKGRFQYQSDGTCTTIANKDGKVILSNHPIYGTQVFGVWTAETIEEAGKVLEYVQGSMARNPHPVQCAGEL